MNFYLPEDHFLSRLGKHFKKEGKIEKEENGKLEKLSEKEKLKEGYLIESATVVELGEDEVFIDISEAECNLSDGSSLKIIDFSSGFERKASVISSEGKILCIEPYQWWPKTGSELKLVKHFTAFDFMISRREDDYYRLLRTKFNVERVSKKLNRNSKPIGYSIQKVEKMGNLDPSQIDAFNNCIGAESVTLVQGPPGTGKTTFAAQLAKHLLDHGFEIMVTAFTHDAINNILERNYKLGVPVSKIGKKSKCSEPLRPYRKDSFSSNSQSKSVVGMTIHELLKNHKKFDFILVDEASQMDIVSGIHFLASSTKTIFIGDHMQLPNISKIPNTKFSVSIFDLLLKTYQTSMLLTTYRFNQSICDYISPNFYEGKLICGESVKDNFLVVDRSSDQNGSYLDEILSPEAMFFLHTEEEVDFLLNKEQANITADLIDKLVSAGVAKNEIGVIAPNNMQVNYIKKVLSARKLDWKGIQIETVNKFQGQEKDVIIFSSVVTMLDSDKARYDFFLDIRRFNVAVSRARKKIIVMGNRNLFEASSTLFDGAEKVGDYLAKAKTINAILTS
ncbi:AAA domain-containing protein [Algoriphagus persicinus]|uniref:AAA domain-containing protein n=1 Tax=Algoriphagus persicinus TaxID=3108754 RepID=UPI002B36459A|nr:AAA domain-containing protein [Algoriphagus sp. E1-3-M2]MEB2786506.1 AAA domain-containing protein [Algoriphagus sp. E1-3-M2]